MISVQCVESVVAAPQPRLPCTTRQAQGIRNLAGIRAHPYAPFICQPDALVPRQKEVASCVDVISDAPRIPAYIDLSTGSLTASLALCAQVLAIQHRTL